MHLSALSRKFIFAIGDQYRYPQLAKLQRIKHCGMFGSKWNIYITSISINLQCSLWKTIGSKLAG